MGLQPLDPELEKRLPPLFQQVRQFYWSLSDEERAKLDNAVASQKTRATVEPEKPVKRSDKSLKFCYDCGGQINRSASFCEFCGVEQPSLPDA